MSIFIFSKPIHSGKTTALMNWCKHQKKCAGILMPDIDGIRKMYDIKAAIFFECECKMPLITNERLVSIGKYHFYQSAFDQANSIIVNGLNKDTNWLIVDEIGKLELDKKGFYSSIKQVIESTANKGFKGNVLLVIRESLLDEIIIFFEIKEFTVMKDLPL